MKTRLFILALITIMLLAACSSDKRTGYYLEGEQESVAYLNEGSTLVEIRFTPDDINRMKSESGKEGGEMFSTLFSTKDYSYDKVSGDDFDLRTAYYESLAVTSGKDSAIEAIRANYRTLSSSNFIETVDGISGSFDEKAFAKSAGKSKACYSYSFSSISENVGDGELENFLSLWLNSAL